MIYPICETFPAFISRIALPGFRRRYLGPSEWSDSGDERTLTFQGGYYCSVRASTEYENSNYVLSAPNYWSRYMDTKVGSYRVFEKMVDAHCV